MVLPEKPGSCHWYHTETNCTPWQNKYYEMNTPFTRNWSVDIDIHIFGRVVAGVRLHIIYFHQVLIVFVCFSAVFAHLPSVAPFINMG